MNIDLKKLKKVFPSYMSKKEQTMDELGEDQISYQIVREMDAKGKPSANAKIELIVIRGPPADGV